ncbi:hypothetical protein PPL_03110 [Heterostelium album PN500]|uniref:B box-type domain-containing protein n=1 Tax=Heterostelium pallidum (strain ATCC 26659 / Pp 5 / PN500) TaxID=670386 RepID=D3B3Y9_HETP5|nr:hypothetical protein PPL_03110 [Heterostelium album PN500]EFA84037.1 hypothetical protein PPL_03110 [Heterostelium album PN500]|eukprot:XP_020436154.1 hypothetical protein PPL_03110 [Heterostelium album PN500]
MFLDFKYSTLLMSSSYSFQRNTDEKPLIFRDLNRRTTTTTTTEKLSTTSNEEDYVEKDSIKAAVATLTNKKKRTFEPTEMASNTERLKKALSDETYDDIDGVVDSDTNDQMVEEDDDIPKGMCVECTDQPASIHCDQCQDDLCEVCGYSIHRRGKRKLHTYTDLLSGSALKSFENGPHRPSGSTSSAGEKLHQISTSRYLNLNKSAITSTTTTTTTAGMPKMTMNILGNSVFNKSIFNLHNNNNNIHHFSPLPNNNNNNNHNNNNNSSSFVGDSLHSISSTNNNINHNHNNKGLGVGFGADPLKSHRSFTQMVHDSNSAAVNGGANGHRKDDDDDDEIDEEEVNRYIRVPKSMTDTVKSLNQAYFMERSKYIPVRLSLQERNLLRLLEASLHVSEYTDKVDIQISNRPKRINDQLRHICAILCGLLVASDFKKGQQLVEKKDFSDNEMFFQTVFEIGRRHKIMNPAKMRAEYGKMIHLLQDSSQREIRDALGLELVSDLKTVYAVLEECDGLKLLSDPLLDVATREVLPDGKQRHEIQHDIKVKERAIKMLSNKYASSTLSTDQIEQCIYSIGDNHTYLRENRDSVRKMIKYLKTYFDPENEEQYFSLRITPGQAGARLNHSHQKQYMYVYQSLTLWKKILHDMFRLWYLAEYDLLRGNSYSLRNTGQGLNRIQAAPKISSAMGKILHSAQTKVGQYWVGSSVVHLGDHNVPNALTFIDKYTQISRILNPIVIAIDFIPKIKDPGLQTYILNTFGSQKNLVKLILSDFFKHAFDGSGADNFFDAGSCIDGRLTSAWNWCSKIEKKNYYSIFLLSGFNGFDGSFN